MLRRNVVPYEPLDPRMQGILDRIESLDLRAMSEEQLVALQEEFGLVEEDEFVRTTLLDEGWMWYDRPAPGCWLRDSRPPEDLAEPLRGEAAPE
jgi:hypothetical protein